MRCGMPLAILCGVSLLSCAAGEPASPEPMPSIRPDHPRLFVNREILADIRRRTAGPDAGLLQSLVGEVGRVRAREGTDGPPKDLGVAAAKAAFLLQITGETSYRGDAVAWLRRSLAQYDTCFREKKAVDWYSTSRVHATLAWDWLYEFLSETERRELLEQLVDAVDRVLEARPRIYRENYSGYTTGFYGVHNCCWFIGVTAQGTGIRVEKTAEWLRWGYAENMKMLAHRRRSCGDDGGSASPTLGYAFGAYPWAEQNFFYTMLSATGRNIAPEWPHSAWLPAYVIRNRIPGDDGPLEFGYGDTPHTDNRLPIGQLYSHMANIRHLFGERLPEAAALARSVQDMLPEAQRKHAGTWFIYPFLTTGADASGPAPDPASLPHGRHFEAMGQVFMRSGDGPDDTYCLFTCGGILSQHRHYDALNFVIVKNGAHLALDSGTRYSQFENGEHLANYFAQTVAHNTILIHRPGEPPAPYWGGTVTGNHGGQHKALGSRLTAFASTPEYVYAAGDATECYRHGGKPDADGNPLSEKTTEVTRQFLFIVPDVFVIFDRVTSTDAAYAKEWLLHTANRPETEGRTVRADFGRGRLLLRTLLPADAATGIVGGPGNEFRAAGTNWEVKGADLTEAQRAMMGRWRLEVRPPIPAERDLFLHVIRVGGEELRELPAMTLEEDAAAVGVRLALAGREWRVLFRREGPLGGTLAVGRPGEPGRTEAPLPESVEPGSGVTSE